MTKKQGYQFRETFVGADGRRHDVRAHTRSELLEKLARAKERAESGFGAFDNSSITVSEWSAKAFNEYKQASEDTRRNEKLLFDKWVTDKIGARKLRTIKSIDCQKILNEAAEEGLSHRSLKLIANLMRFTFRTALQNGIIKINPADGAITPQGVSAKQRRPLTAKEDAIFFKVCETHEKYSFFLTMRVLGLRNSEAARIRWCDIKEKQGQYYLNVRGTKTLSSVRVVPVPVYLIEHLPKRPSPFELVFQNKNGGALSMDSQKKLWASLTNQMQILAGAKTYRRAIVPPYPLNLSDVSPYSLRHTYCTSLVADGVDVVRASKLMGHSSIRMTAEIYSHFTDEMLSEESQRVNNKVWGTEKEHGKVVKIS